MFHDDVILTTLYGVYPKVFAYGASTSSSYSRQTRHDPKDVFVDDGLLS